MIQIKRIKRHRMIRKIVKGTATRPRLSVYRANHALSLQLIDDAVGKTVYGVSSHSLKEASSGIERAEKVAQLIADYCQKNSISTLVFDRGGFAYHGQIKTVAETLRKAGLTV